MLKGEISMENTTIAKKVQKQAAKKSDVASIRVGKATSKQVQQTLEQINKKDFGKRVKLDALVALAMTRITQSDIATLQENSLSNQDRFERDYATYCTEYGKISKDEYLGKRLSGEISAQSKSS